MQSLDKYQHFGKMLLTFVRLTLLYAVVDFEETWLSLPLCRWDTEDVQSIVLYLHYVSCQVLYRK